MHLSRYKITEKVGRNIVARYITAFNKHKLHQISEDDIEEIE